MISNITSMLYDINDKTTEQEVWEYQKE
jgi:hypothetical protein